MSDDDEPPIISTPRPSNDRRLVEIKSRLQGLNREKTKYNVEKLNQDDDFLRGQIEHLCRSIQEINRTIRTQFRQRKALDAERANYKSHSRVHYSNLDAALKEEERLKNELRKPNKSQNYRQLASDKLHSIEREKPILTTLEDYRARLQKLDDETQHAQKRRENFEEDLEKQRRRQGEIRQLLQGSEKRLPEIEKEIELLRAERDEILNAVRGKKPRRNHSDTLRERPLDSPDQSSKLLREQSLEWEISYHQDRLEKIRQLRNYFSDQMSDGNLLNEDASLTSPSVELISPLYQPFQPTNEENLCSSSNEQQSFDAKTTSPIAIAMRLPRNFRPLQLAPLSTTNNEILHSPHYQEGLVEYKKELPSDIVDRYAGVSKKTKPTTPLQSQTPTSHFGKRNRKNKKNNAMKHNAHIISLYDEIRNSANDLLPPMPMYHADLTQTMKALDVLEQSVQSYLNESRQTSISNRDDSQENESIRDSALDTYSETSSLVEPLPLNKDATFIPTEQRSSSSSDEKKTIVSSSSSSSGPSSHQSQSKIDPSSHLTTVEEVSSTNSVTAMDRQISDEGYRSVRNDHQQQHQQAANPPSNDPIPSLLDRSATLDLTERIDLWLSNSPINSASNQTFFLFTQPPMNEFQGIEFDHDDEKTIDPSPSLS